MDSSDKALNILPLSRSIIRILPMDKVDEFCIGKKVLLSAIV
jgi:hypothetical protein